MEDRIEIVRVLIERWNAGDRDTEALSEYLDPEIELLSPFSSVVGEAYRGYAGLERWMSDLDEQFAMWSISPDDVRQIGEQVLAVSAIEARGRASDITLQFPAAAIFDFATNRRITRVRIYTDVAEAWKVVELE